MNEQQESGAKPWEWIVAIGFAAALAWYVSHWVVWFAGGAR